MAKKILTALQENFIFLLAKNKPLKNEFYLSGGTALSAYYLHHRYSEDLDFFSKNEIDIFEINAFLKSIKPDLKIEKLDFQQSFNRNIFFLHTKKEILKVEFTYFPFELTDKLREKDRIFCDSITDIAINKAFIVSQNPRARDFIDLYCILKKYKTLSFKRLTKMARIKFDFVIDPIQLGAQLLKAKSLHDLPIMLQKLDHKKWRAFFINEARSLSKEIFK